MQELGSVSSPVDGPSAAAAPDQGVHCEAAVLLVQESQQPVEPAVQAPVMVLTAAQLEEPRTTDAVAAATTQLAAQAQQNSRQ